ncbi:PstS family phosphate ABC transporter substrate-binding protein [Flavobacterium crassostreae]|uniref:Phosphate ABC transporter substrate-binding protein n=1 Tax=Flavobacterium crassostreae TaxID=1763534 RepID=A0A1B9DZN1_9FLAO|nr:substrate-binding domain-containing protein [Flavobacterium crassostreae]OCB75140.1 phosphate ABC transporter substrate-binding protein [Flavobacterium crassostreae]
MKKIRTLSYLTFLLLFTIIFACKNDSKANKETVIKGRTTILVDASFQPIIEDQIAIFESKYDAKIAMTAKSEKEIVHDFLNDSTGIAILSRTLNENELKNFKLKKIIPKITKIGTDAIAFITHQNSQDTLIALQDVVDFMNGKKGTKIQGLVFDNPNSSTARYINQLSGLQDFPDTGVFSFNTNEDVIKFVSENEGMIGIVGLNWLYQPSPTGREYTQKVKTLSVKDINGTKYISPSQNNLAEETYPLARDLYIINCQGRSGLGMGFASFVSGDIGQRIILKSGLYPVRTPGRKIIFKNNSQNKNENENE